MISAYSFDVAIARLAKQLNKAYYDIQEMKNLKEVFKHLKDINTNMAVVNKFIEQEER